MTTWAWKTFDRGWTASKRTSGPVITSEWSVIRALTTFFSRKLLTRRLSDNGRFGNAVKDAADDRLSAKWPVCRSTEALMRIRRFARMAVVLLLVPCAGSTQTLAPGLAKQVDKVFAKWDREDSPGCALGVYRGGQVVYKRGYGMEDLN